MSCIVLLGNHNAISLGGDIYGSLILYHFGFEQSVIDTIFCQPEGCSVTPLSRMIDTEQLIGQLLSFLAWSESSFINLHILFFFLLPGILIYVIVRSMLSEQSTAIFLFFLITLLFSSYNVYHFYIGHTNFHIGFMLLFIFFCYKSIKNSKLLNFILASIMLAFTFSLNAYYGYFAILILLASFLYLLVYDFQWMKASSSKIIIFVGISTVLVFAEYNDVFFQFLSSSTTLGPVFQKTKSSVIGVYPWMYFLPPIDHVILGEWYVSVYHALMKTGNVPENSVFLGFVPLGLCCYTFYLYYKKRLTLDMRKWVRLLIFLWGMSFVLSLPPFISPGNILIKFPAWYLHDLFPMFRIYARFSLLVLIFTVIIASVGLYHLIKYQKSRYMLGIIFTLLIFERIVCIPFLDVTQYPKVYDWIAEQPGGDILVYELPDDSSLNDHFNYQKYAYFATKHGKKLHNHSMDSSILYQGDIINILKANGVDYIIVHEKMFDMGPVPTEQKKYVHPVDANRVYDKSILNQLKGVLPEVYQDEDSTVYSLAIFGVSEKVK